MFLLGRSLVLEGHLDDPVMIWVEGTVVIDLLVECKSWAGEGGAMLRATIWVDRE